MRNQRGFSLIEIVIVLAVTAILTGVSIPVYVGMKPVIRLSGATRQLMEDLMWARMQAINQNNQFRIIYDSNHEYRIWDDDNNDGTIDATESKIKKDLHDQYDDVIYSSSNTNGLIFYPRGNAANLTTITLSNKSGFKTVSVAITGRVKKQ